MEKNAIIAYNPAFDCIRGISILLVLFFHFTTPYKQLFMSNGLLAKLWFHFANMGWIGVDIFFVLSGYLITNILINTREADNYYSAFYIRRTFRIFPVYYLALIVSFVIIPFTSSLFKYDVFSNQDYSNIYSNQLWAWLYLSNIPSSFLDPQIMNGGFLLLVHFWSLSVEEQFYIFWPFLIRKFEFSSIKAWCLGLLVFAFLLRFTFNKLGFHYNSSYSFTFCRLDCMCAGALVALKAIDRKHHKTNVLFSKAFKCVVLFSGSLFLAYLFLDESWHKKSFFVQVFGYSILALFFSEIISFVASRKIKKGDLKLHFKVLMNLGKYSYGLYIWHLFAYPFFKLYLSNEHLLSPFGFSNLTAVVVQIFLLACLSIAAGYCSYHVFEKFFLKIKPKYRMVKKVKLISSEEILPLKFS